MATMQQVQDHWHHHFDNLQYSSNEFYSQIEQLIKNKELPDVKVKRVSHSEKGGLLGKVFSDKREYLEVSHRDAIFKICAAPFGKEFFVSSWLGDRGKKTRTFYEHDIDIMFTESIHSIVLTVVDSIVEKKGLRALTGNERLISQAEVA